MTDRPTGQTEPTSRGSVRAAPILSEAFTDQFHSTIIQAGEVRLHAVIGGSGPPLLLLAGWPQNWYAWREMMPELARHFTVVAADPRGVGLSDKPRDGYDTATLATDMVELMRALGHERFSMVGHDIGMWVGYALAADHPQRLERLAVAEAVIPGLAPSPPLHLAGDSVDRLWHFVFNRLGELNEQLVQGREQVFFGHQFMTKAARPLEEHAVDHYIDLLASDPDALRASFEPYRHLDTTIAQNTRRARHPLRLPILTIAGEHSVGDAAGTMLEPVAEDLSSVVLADCGHYPAEESPHAMLTALGEFLHTP